jgi:thiol:disulfide interchange protein DsbD
MRIRLIFSALVFWFACTHPLAAQVRDGRSLVKASLIADTTAVVPGRAFQAALVLEMAEGWHTYWEYPGDSGLATSLDWSLPDGFIAGPLEWPLPESKLEPGDIQIYGYSGRVVIPVTLTPPATLSGDSVTLRAKASWLVCAEICVPGDAALELGLPVATSASPANGELFEAARGLVPSALPPPFELRWARSGADVLITAPGREISFFPLPRENEAVGHPVATASGEVRLSMPFPARGVLATGAGSDRRGWFVVEPAELTTSPLSLRWALFYGFLGGLLLNLMPCVLPVISLKIFGFIRQAGDSRWSILIHGLAFAAGIFAWFLLLGVVVVGLRAGGGEVTWAFQFQNPWFNMAIGSIVFVFALNLAGVFEFVLPGKAAGALEATGDREGLAGSFFQGVFATLLATPCTAPFLGTALGFAFSQSAAVILGMFAAVAGGMALPYVMLSAQPSWLKILPKPGVWMERLKQFMAFPLFATLVWILSILGGQRGVEGVVWFCAFLLCLGLACWIFGAFCGPLSKPAARWLALALIACLVTGGAVCFLPHRAAGTGSEDAIEWVGFTPGRLQAETAAGRTVFVDFTADWCITCKFNERTAINTPAVRRILRERGIVAMKADWTNANPEITAALKSFGRVGVPFYVIYPGTGTPVPLPELLTENLLLEALENAR